MTALSDREVVELLGDRPDLLAVADAVAATQRPDRRLRRAPFVVAPVAAAAAVVLALFAPWQSGGPSVVERALAAVGPGPVVHAVVEYSSPEFALVEIATGRERPRVRRTEYWYDAERKLLHTRLFTDGVLLTEIVETPERAYSDLGDFPTGGGFAPQLDPALAGFVTGYREALADGTAELVGETSAQGRKAKLLRIRLDHGGAVQEVAVDAETYAPLQFLTWYPGGRRSSIGRVVSIQSVPRDEALFAPPPRSAPRPTGGSGGGGRRATLAEAQEALGAAPIVLADRRPEEIRVVRVTAHWTDGRETTGNLVRIEYGGRLQVNQAIDYAGRYAIGFGDGGDPAPPPGWMEVRGGPTSRPEAELEVGGVAVRIVAPRRELLLEAARGLRPAP